MFSDIQTLRNVLTTTGRTGITVVPGFAGSVNVKLGSQSFTLTPDCALTTIPAAEAGKSFWTDSATGRYYIVNADGTAQGFKAK